MSASINMLIECIHCFALPYRYACIIIDYLMRNFNSKYRKFFDKYNKTVSNITTSKYNLLSNENTRGSGVGEKNGRLRFRLRAGCSSLYY